MIKRFALALVVAGVIPATMAAGQAPAEAATGGGCSAWKNDLMACIKLEGGKLVGTGKARNGAEKNVKIQICRQFQACTKQTSGLRTEGFPAGGTKGKFEVVVFNGKASQQSLILSL